MPKKKNQQIKKNIQGVNAKAPVKSVRSEYAWSMSEAPQIGESRGLIQAIPMIFFTAFIIMLMRAVRYTRHVEEFYWINSNGREIDIFSYCKMTAIIICAAVVLLIIAYRAFAQNLTIRKTIVYIPMAAYSIFVILSYIFSDYKEFSLLGFNERFEGTLVLLSYMIMLFYIVNTVNAEKDVKFIVYPLAASSALLGILGISQAAGYDFFKTEIGNIVMIPKGLRDSIVKLDFIFEKGEIYQTVYNTNYVSFYLSLLIPVLGVLFINSIMNGKNLIIKIIWGALFALALFNLVGSNSIGGAMGLGIAAIVAVILLGRKLFTDWRKPVLIALAITILIVGGVGYKQWLPKIAGTIHSTFSGQAESQISYDTAISPDTEIAPDTETALNVQTSGKSYIDYMEIDSAQNKINVSINGNKVTFILLPSVEAVDEFGKPISFTEDPEWGYRLDDERFRMCTVGTDIDDEGNPYFIITTDGQDWFFRLTEDGVFFENDVGKLTEMKKIEAIGFKNNQSFGSGRGYIWSRTLPMIKDTILIGHGADTYSIYFPHNDYIGKYNAGWNINMVVDKPHNMYMHMAVGTGLLSLFAFLILLVLYFVQSVKLYWRRDFNTFTEFAGVGIFLGVVGFSVSALVNDSSVSVMPMFYGLLGTGIAINIMLKRLPISYN